MAATIGLDSPTPRANLSGRDVSGTPGRFPMNEVPFYQTRAGRTFYEKTLPELVEQIRRLADAVERLEERIGTKRKGEEV